MTRSTATVLRIGIDCAVNSKKCGFWDVPQDPVVSQMPGYKLGTCSKCSHTLVIAERFGVKYIAPNGATIKAKEFHSQEEVD